MNKLALCLFSVVAFSSVVAHASVHYQSKDVGTIAQIDDFKIPVASADLIFEVTKRSDSSLTKEGLVRGLIENYVFAREAEREFGKNILVEKTKVAFSNQVHLDRDFVKTFLQRYHGDIQSSIKQLPTRNLTSLIRQPFRLDADKFKNTTVLEGSLEYALTKQQIEQAKQLVLITYQLPKKNSVDTLSLWDIYSRQNLQGRIAIHQQNRSFLEKQTSEFLLEKYIHYWAYNESGLAKSDVDALVVMFKDRFLKKQYLERKGLLVDMHHQNLQQTAMAQRVTKEEVFEYYQKHKEEFQIVEKVKARHIRLDSQELADRVYKDVTKGLSFDAAVARYSISDDKNLPVPGDLGWIKNKDKRSSWLKGVAFIQTENVISKPFRSPQNSDQPVYWEIILVKKKVVGYQAPDSEGVRYEASRHIAKRKMAEEFESTRRELLGSASIEINQTLLGRHVY